MEGLAYIDEGGEQLGRHAVIMKGTAGNPRQYRVLSEYLVEGLIRTLRNFNVPRPVASAFISFRILENILIFLLASIYYRKLGLNIHATLIGLSLLAWAMTHSLYESALQFDTYADVIFYLLAAVTILSEKYVGFLLVSGAAALNRETSGLIPFMIISNQLFSKSKSVRNKRAMAVFLTSLCLYIIVYVSIRLSFGKQPLHEGYGLRPGFEYFMFNVSRYTSWFYLFATLGILPIMSVLSIRHCPMSLQAFFWGIVPIWVLVHLFFGFIAETRVFLVPLALVFVPGALFGAVVQDQNELSSPKSSPI
jgi:hypothetical protein